MIVSVVIVCYWDINNILVSVQFVMDMISFWWQSLNIHITELYLEINFLLVCIQVDVQIEISTIWGEYHLLISCCYFVHI